MITKMNKEEINNLMDTALNHINSVPYAVSLRWVFYRLYQEGLYTKKEHYKNRFVPITSYWRKEFKRGWYPSIVKDDTRRIYWYGIGDKNQKEFIDNLEVKLDKFQNQDYFIFILFEAAAMFDQFRYYTKNIPLIAFKGDPSIELKWRMAKAIEWADKEYKKPIQVLYFGDADDKGGKIWKAALKDIKAWCNVQFDFYHCGLTLKQAKQFNLPISIDAKGYQWEALTDEQAKEIITNAVEPYQDKKKFALIEKKEKLILNKIKKLNKEKKKK